MQPAAVAAEAPLRYSFRFDTKRLNSLHIHILLEDQHPLVSYLKRRLAAAVASSG